MTQKHTQGPWGIKSLSYNPRPIMIYRQSDLDDEKNGRKIRCPALAHVFSGGTRNSGDWNKAKQDDECSYNARLIAAAPELLEALKLAYGSMCDAYNDFAASPKGQRIKAAIEKATGEIP